jgi:hypothetical protein
LSLVTSVATAGCRGVEFVDECGLELQVTADAREYAPRDSVTFTMVLSNRGELSVYVPGSFLEYGPLPCAVPASGKVEHFKATFAAPDCKSLPDRGDLILEPGDSVTFAKSAPALPEPGLQQWSFEGALYRCPAIPHSVDCGIESNMVEVMVRPER